MHVSLYFRIFTTSVTTQLTQLSSIHAHNRHLDVRRIAGASVSPRTPSWPSLSGARSPISLTPVFAVDSAERSGASNTSSAAAADPGRFLF